MFISDIDIKNMAPVGEQQQREIRAEMFRLMGKAAKKQDADKIKKILCELDLFNGYINSVASGIFVDTLRTKRKYTRKIKTLDEEGPPRKKGPSGCALA